MKSFRGLIFTDKEHSLYAIMSTILGILASGTLGTAVYLSFLNGGEASDRYAAAALIAVLFMVAGLGLGLWSTTERDKFKLFTVLGIAVNVIAFGILSLILFAGAYVD